MKIDKDHLSLNYLYLEDFVKFQMSHQNENLFKVFILTIHSLTIHSILSPCLQVIYVMLAVATSEYLSEIQGGEYLASPSDLPRVPIPLLHIVYGEMKERISFVTEAISTGYYYPKGHLIRLNDSLINPKTYSTLKNLDFDLFESIIKECWKKVTSYLNSPDSPESIECIHSVQRSRHLIEENLFLFYRDFSKELIPLRYLSILLPLNENEFCTYSDIKSSRCRWRAIDMVVIFVNNVVQVEFEDLLKSQNLLRSSLNTLHTVSLFINYSVYVISILSNVDFIKFKNQHEFYKINTLFYTINIRQNRHNIYTI